MKIKNSIIVIAVISAILILGLLFMLYTFRSGTPIDSSLIPQEDWPNIVSKYIIQPKNKKKLIMPSRFYIRPMWDDVLVYAEFSDKYVQNYLGKKPEILVEVPSNDSNSKDFLAYIIGSKDPFAPTWWPKPNDIKKACVYYSSEYFIHDLEKHTMYYRSLINP